MAHMYGPGRPFNAWNSRAVSSVKAGPPIYSNTISHCNLHVKVSHNQGTAQPGGKLTGKSLAVSYHFCCTSAFLFGYVFNWSLDLRHIDGLVFNINDTTKYSPHLCEFILVSGNKIQLVHGSHNATPCKAQDENVGEETTVCGVGKASAVQRDVIGYERFGFWGNESCVLSCTWFPTGPCTEYIISCTHMYSIHIVYYYTRYIDILTSTSKTWYELTSMYPIFFVWYCKSPYKI